MELSRWLAMPQQVEERVAFWEREHPGQLVVDAITQHTGHRVLALTVGAPPAGAPLAAPLAPPLAPLLPRPAAWFCVPHAHEPAGTAAIMDILQQLLTGRDLAGAPAGFDYRAARERLTLTFNPDANPGGRTWSPCVWWDGSRYSNGEFWTWMRGLDGQTGEMWKRVARWSLRQEHPLRRGIVYEQLNEHEFVEPNRDPGSSLVRLFRRLDARYAYRRSMHLHQTEFASSDRNCMINLPVLQPELPPPVQEANVEWARAVIARWTALGAAPVPEPRGFPYVRDTETVRWFRDCWGESQQRTPEIVVEVQNNNPRTPPEAQLELERVAIITTIEGLLDETPT
jgi:hypothetical protein